MISCRAVSVLFCQSMSWVFRTLTCIIINYYNIISLDRVGRTCMPYPSHASRREVTGVSDFDQGLLYRWLANETLAIWTS